MNLYESITTKLKESTDHKTFNYNGTECWMEIGTYSQSPTVMAIQFMCDEGPYTTASVNLGEDAGNNSVIPFGATFLDTNNNSGIDDFFKEIGLGEVYTRFGEEVTMQSGFCEYPLFQFNVNKLKEYDPKGFSKYESSYRANLDKARSKVIGEGQDLEEGTKTQDFINNLDADNLAMRAAGITGDTMTLDQYQKYQDAIHEIRKNDTSRYDITVSYWDRNGYPKEKEYVGRSVKEIAKKFVKAKETLDYRELSDYSDNLYELANKSDCYGDLEEYLEKVANGETPEIVEDSEKAPTSTEEYWDATELDREGFYALLKFNHPEKHMNPSLKYIITNDNNEVYRFAMQGEDETNKDTGAKIEFRKYINKGE